MPSENFAKIFSGRALNRPRESRGSQPSACFCGTFCTPQKVPKTVPFAGSSEVLQTSNQHTKQQLRTNKIKTFFRPCLPPHGRLAHVRSQFSLFRRSPTHKNLPPATFCTSERVFAVLFARRKKYQKPFPCRELRGFANLNSARRNGGFARTKLNPFAASRQCPCRDGTLRVLFGCFLHVAKSDNSYSLAGRFEVFQTSNQHTQTKTSHKPT